MIEQYAFHRNINAQLVVHASVFSYFSLNELVQHQENSLVFHDGELAQQLQDWFREFPSKRSGDQFKKAIQDFQSLRWHDNWKIQAFPLFNFQ